MRSSNISTRPLQVTFSDDLIARIFQGCVGSISKTRCCMSTLALLPLKYTSDCTSNNITFSRHTGSAPLFWTTEYGFSFGHSRLLLVTGVVLI